MFMHVFVYVYVYQVYGAIWLDSVIVCIHTSTRVREMDNHKEIELGQYWPTSGNIDEDQQTTIIKIP